MKIEIRENESIYVMEAKTVGKKNLYRAWRQSNLEGIQGFHPRQPQADA